MIKKKYYNMTDGVNPKLKKCVDKDLVLRLEEVGDLVYVDADLLYYRSNPNNLTNSESPKEEKYNNKMRIQMYNDARNRRKL